MVGKESVQKRPKVEAPRREPSWLRAWAPPAWVEAQGAPDRGRAAARHGGEARGLRASGRRRRPPSAGAFGLRRTRYRRLAKTRLQHVAPAAAFNLDRIAAWLRGRPLAPTRTLRFAALMA